MFFLDMHTTFCISVYTKMKNKNQVVGAKVGLKSFLYHHLIHKLRQEIRQPYLFLLQHHEIFPTLSSWLSLVSNQAQLKPGSGETLPPCFCSLTGSI